MGRRAESSTPSSARPDTYPQSREGLVWDPLHNKFGEAVDLMVVTNPDGKRSERLQPTFYRGATMTVVVANGIREGDITGRRIITNREKVHGTDEYNLEFPGGVKGPDDPQEAVMQKVKLELGVVPSNASITPLGIIRTDIPHVWNVTELTIAEVDTVGAEPDEPTLKRTHIPTSRLRDMVIGSNPEINTAMIALQALIVADHLGESPKSTYLLPGGKRWMDEKPGQWRMETLLMRRDGSSIDTRGGVDILSRSIVHQTETEQLIHDRTQKPKKPDQEKAEEGDQYILNYPRHTQVIPVDVEAGTVYLPKRFSTTYNETVYTLPSSAVGEDESYGEAAKRIARDEFGIDPTNTQLYDLGLWGETTSRLNFKSRIAALHVSATDMQGRDDVVCIKIEDAWEAVKTGQEIAGIKLDTLTPALAVGLLHHTELQVPYDFA